MVYLFSYEFLFNISGSSFGEGPCEILLLNLELEVIKLLIVGIAFQLYLNVQKIIIWQVHLLWSTGNENSDSLLLVCS